jgi:hypothetical protein
MMFFNHAVSSLEMMDVRWILNLEGFERKRSWPNPSIISVSDGGTEVVTKNFNHESQSGQAFEPMSPIYEFWALQLTSARSVH